MEEVEGEVETLMRRWCDDLAIPASQRPDDLTDRLVVVIDQERHMFHGDMDVVYDIAAKDYAAIETSAPQVAAEIRRIVPWDIWGHAFLVLTPDDPPGADSTIEAHKLWAICLRTGIWRLHRLLVDPDSVPPRGVAAADAIRAMLGLPAIVKRAP